MFAGLQGRLAQQLPRPVFVCSTMILLRLVLGVWRVPKEFLVLWCLYSLLCFGGGVGCADSCIDVTVGLGSHVNGGRF